MKLAPRARQVEKSGGGVQGLDLKKDAGKASGRVAELGIPMYILSPGVGESTVQAG